MKARVEWQGKGLEFKGIANGRELQLDAPPPLGKGAGSTPKELLLVALVGCTAMDVVALLAKAKTPPVAFEVGVEATPSTEGHPYVFKSAQVTFTVSGEVAPERLLEAVKLSQTQYCSVGAMLSKAFPIDYRVVLNGKDLGDGEARFSA
jgi:putative redox protein